MSPRVVGCQLSIPFPFHTAFGLKTCLLYPTNTPEFSDKKLRIDADHDMWLVTFFCTRLLKNVGQVQLFLEERHMQAEKAKFMVSKLYVTCTAMPLKPLDMTNSLVK